MHVASRFHLRLMHIAAIALLVVVGSSTPKSSLAQDAGSELPPITLDVLDDFVWSISELWVAPGQEIEITNRDVDRHTFTVDAWGIDENLPSLTTVTVIVPSDAKIGQSYVFYSTVPGDREHGLVGEILVVSAEEVLAGIVFSPNLGQGEPASRVRIEARDDFSFAPAIISVGPGTIIEVVNTGVIEHHFVIDAWNVNQTVSPGKTVLVLVPATAQTGSSVEMYCSMPGHLQQGMVGVIRITGDQSEISTVVRTTGGRTISQVDMRPFVPGAEKLGDGWSRLRSGSSESILGKAELNRDVFPYSGLGAIYVGPNGARVTVLVLPLQTTTVPLSQIKEAIADVQSSLANGWTMDPIASAALRSKSPPNGCTTSTRTSGIVPTFTIPGGATSCQLSGVGVALFVAVEGDFEDVSGVVAADRIIVRILGGEAMVGMNRGVS